MSTTTAPVLITDTSLARLHKAASDLASDPLNGRQARAIVSILEHGARPAPSMIARFLAETNIDGVLCLGAHALYGEWAVGRALPLTYDVFEHEVCALGGTVVN